MLVLEGLCVTTDLDGRPHVAAMGPLVEERERAAGRITRLVLRPFPESTTAANLGRTGAGVFHLTDDVGLLAAIVAGRAAALPPLRPATAVAGFVLDDACLAWEFRCGAIDRSEPRTRIDAEVVAEHVGRPFLGFNRAAHAVVEAAILVTRLHLVPAEEVHRRMADLAVLVEKTGGIRERQAFDLLRERVGPPTGDGGDDEPSGMMRGFPPPKLSP